MKPSENLMALSIACRVHFTWFGTRKTLSIEQKNEAAEQFGADGSALSASKRLLNTKHSAYRAVNAVRSEARHYWKHMTLPWPEAGIRLLRRTALDEFKERMRNFKTGLQASVDALTAEYPTLRNDARASLGELFNARDYPDTLQGCFAIDWDFPSVEPPPYLATLDPQLYEEQKAIMAARFQEATMLAEKAFAEELSQMVAHLADKLTDGPDGRKTFRSSTLTNLHEFFDRFKSLNVGSNSELDKIVEQAKETLSGVDAKGLKKDADLRSDLAAKMTEISAAIESKLTVAPKRRIIGIFDEEEAPESAADTVAA